MWEYFDEELQGVIQYAIELWKANGAKVIALEHILHVMIKKKFNIVLNTFKHFKINTNDIIKDIESANFMKNVKNNVQNLNNINLDESIANCIAEAVKFVQKNTGDIRNNKVTVDHYFLAMCIESSSKLNAFLNQNGISNNVIEEYLYSLEDTSLFNNNNQINNDDGDIIGKGASNDGIDTLEPPNPNNKEQSGPNNKGPRLTNMTPKNSNKTMYLDHFGVNLLEYVKTGKIDNIIGRSKEIETLMEILCRKNKRNAMLIGDPGVGKTAVVEGLAIELYNNRVPLPLRNKKIIQLDINNIVSGTRFRGDFEERIQGIITELTRSPDIIIFIDEIHTIMGAGNSIGGLDIGNVLKPALARGEIQVIGATTQDEYSKYIMKDGALERRFQVLQVNEPSNLEVKEILYGLKETFENFHSINVTDNAIDAIVRYTEQYMPMRFHPDKDIDILDNAGARSKMRTMNIPNDIKQLREQLNDIRTKKDNAARSQDTNLAAEYYKLELSLMQKLENKESKYYESIDDERVDITDYEIAEVISKLTDIPTPKLTQNEAEKLLNLDNIIKDKLVGQDGAVESVCKAIRRARTDLHQKHKPIGNFLFIGPTGVGKTELARQLTKELFGKEENLLKFDMSEYTERFDISKLLGSAPGFVGYEEGGKLTEAVRKSPYSIILFDEIEKAHPDIYNIFLQIMEDGVVTDSKGRKVYFNNAIIIMTSNVGAEKAFSSKKLGFGEEDSDKRATDIIKKEANNTFRPEFLNRLDDIITFHQLKPEHISKIVDLAIDKVNDRIKHRNMIIKITEAMKNYIIKEGYNEKYGARPINRAITSSIEDYMAIRMLTNEYSNNMEFEFDYVDGGIKCNVTKIKSNNNIDYSYDNDNNSESNDTPCYNNEFMEMFNQLSQ